jgi:hypothetical protein
MACNPDMGIDSPSTQISVCVPIDTSDWLEENRSLLARFRQATVASS